MPGLRSHPWGAMGLPKHTSSLSDTLFCMFATLHQASSNRHTGPSCISQNSSGPFRHTFSSFISTALRTHANNHQRSSAVSPVSSLKSQCTPPPSLRVRPSQLYLPCQPLRCEVGSVAYRSRHRKNLSRPNQIGMPSPSLSLHSWPSNFIM